ARARTKLGDLADRIYLTSEALEQATRPALAARHASRFVQAGVTRMADLCCGAAGDLLAFATAERALLAVDRDPLVCEIARANLAALGLDRYARVDCADVTRIEASDLQEVDGVFIDPARRSSRGRTFDPGSYSPPFGFVLDLPRSVAATGAKLAP